MDLFTVKGVPFVTVNSMAMQDDGCFLCAAAKDKLAKVSKELDCLRNKEACEVDYDFGSEAYGQPVLLQHFPLFRRSDAHCDEEDGAPPGEKEAVFREDWDCVSRESSRHLLEVVQPRLVLSGHTHHGCRTEHRCRKTGQTVPEWSVSSFSWRNRNNPAFLLASISHTDYAISKCFLPRESTVITIYFMAAFAYLGLLIKAKWPRGGGRACR